MNVFAGVECPECQCSDHKVVETRRAPRSIYRQRRCLRGHTFWTQEQISEPPPQQLRTFMYNPLKEFNK